MAIAYAVEDTETDVVAGTTITSSSHTIADNEYVIVCVAAGNSGSDTGNFSGVTINGNAMTKLVESAVADGTQGWFSTSIWGFQATTGFTGTAVATNSVSTSNMAMAVLSITGHDTGTTIGDVDNIAGNTSGGTPVSRTLTTASGDLVIDCLAGYGAYGNDLAKHADQTLVLDTGAIGTNSAFGMSTKVATGSSTTVSWTNPSDFLFRYCAVVVKQASASTIVPLLHHTQRMRTR